MAIDKTVRYPGRWNPVSDEFPLGEPKNRTSATSKDGTYLEKDWVSDIEAFFGALMTNAGFAANGKVDTALDSQFFDALSLSHEVSPLNNDWNGYLDPEHQSSFPSAGGYPGNSGGGEVSYPADAEISYGIFAGAGGATVSSDSDGWIFTGSIYKLYDYTTEQLDDIVATEVPVYLKNQVGTESFLKHNGSSVIVTKVGSQLKVEITDTIFAGSFTKLWRFFPTERVGRVVELGPDESRNGIWIVRAENSSGWGSGAVVSFDDISNDNEVLLECYAISSGRKWTMVIPVESFLDSNEIQIAYARDAEFGENYAEVYINSISGTSLTVITGALGSWEAAFTGIYTRKI